MKKVGLFGGSFDPIHTGHLHIALDAKRQLSLSEVWFLPTVSTPLKGEQTVSFDHRVKMIRLMIAPYRKLKVCLIEASLDQPNYTVNTVKELLNAYPDHEFHWILGSDQANQFSRWKDHETLRRLLKFVVYPRNPKDDIPSWMVSLKTKDYLKYSSTQIRQGEVGLTSPKVVAYMMRHGLYAEEIGKAMVSAKRWIHVDSMRNLALRLAGAHHLDETRVNLAALLHDCMKNKTMDELRAILTIAEPDYLKQPPAIWHQRAGMHYAKRVLMINDKSVLKAIGHHVEGDVKDPLVKVIYLADKLDESRGYDSSELIGLAMKNLDLAVKQVRLNQQAYLKKEGVDV